LHSAYGAARLLFPAREPITLAQPRPGTVPESLSDAQQALAWLKAEHHVLLAAVAQAATHGFDTQAWQLPWSLGIYLDRQGHWRDFLVTQTTALAAAERLGDTAALMSSRLDLGRAYAKLGSYQEAQFHVRHALALAEHESDEVGQARVHHILSWVLGKQGHISEALGHAERSLSLYRAAEYRAGQATALNDIGWYNSVLGNHAQALAYCQQALDVCTELGNQAGLASAWDSLGYAHHQLGNNPYALTCYQHALDLYVKQGDLYHQANVLAHIGDTHHATGHAQLARDAWLQALSVLDDLQHPDADNIRTKLHAQTPPAHGYKAAESPTTSER
jgi:tetratricopeptide (TPR) repeat protein